jgi:hypothetical protein
MATNKERRDTRLLLSKNIEKKTSDPHISMPIFELGIFSHEELTGLELELK